MLAPDHVGLTVHDQPALYWLASEAVTTSITVEVIVMKADGVKPILRAMLPPLLGPGIQQIRLANHNIHLVPDAHYEWSVTLRHQQADLLDTVGFKGVSAYDRGKERFSDSHHTIPLQFLDQALPTEVQHLSGTRLIAF